MYAAAIRSVAGEEKNASRRHRLVCWFAYCLKSGVLPFRRPATVTMGSRSLGASPVVILRWADGAVVCSSRHSWLFTLPGGIPCVLPGGVVQCSTRVVAKSTGGRARVTKTSLASLGPGIREAAREHWHTSPLAAVMQSHKLFFFSLSVKPPQRPPKRPRAKTASGCCYG